MQIAIALGGGGSKGYAHIGVLKVLQREGIEISAIAGTSMGGVIGGAYAAGFTAVEIEGLMAGLNQGDLFSRAPDEGPAYLGLSGVASALDQAFGETTFADLSIPFAVTAVDIETAELLAIRSGLVREALLATIAVPGIFPPQNRDGRTLIDGGILDPVPVALARNLAPGAAVMAVVLSPPIENWVRRPTPRLLASLPFLGKYLARLRLARAINIFLGAVDISGALLTELRLQTDSPEVIIRPQVHQIGLVDEVNVGEITRIGERAMEESLHEVYRLGNLGWRLIRRINRRTTQPSDDRYVT